MLYIQSADRLQRTARWVESLGEGGKNGLEYLKRVIIDDSLGICKDLDQAMELLVGVYFDEWAEVVRSPEKRSLFRQVYLYCNPCKLFRVDSRTVREHRRRQTWNRTRERKGPISTRKLA